MKRLSIFVLVVLLLLVGMAACAKRTVTATLPQATVTHNNMTAVPRTNGMPGTTATAAPTNAASATPLNRPVVPSLQPTQAASPTAAVR